MSVRSQLRDEDFEITIEGVIDLKVLRRVLLNKLGPRWNWDLRRLIDEIEERIEVVSREPLMRVFRIPVYYLVNEVL